MKTILTTATAILLAALLLSGTTASAGQIRAAIILSNGQYYNNEDACIFMAYHLARNGIQPEIVHYQQIDTVAEILRYDVFIFGSCGHYYEDNLSGYGLVQDEVRSFVEDHGRGVVGVGGANYTSALNHYPDYDAVMPVHILVPYGYFWGYDVTITEPSHPITYGVANFQFGSESLAEWCPGGIKTTASVLGEYDQNGQPSVTYWSTGPAQGRAVHLGPFYLADVDNFATLALYQNPDTVQLLVNAVRWASSKFALDLDHLIGGQQTTIKVVNAQPSDRIILAYSRHGGGPTGSQWGTLYLTPPIKRFPDLYADANGMAVHTVICPSKPGLHLWFQALDFEAGVLSNGWNGEIE